MTSPHDERSVPALAGNRPRESCPFGLLDGSLNKPTGEFPQEKNRLAAEVMAATERAEDLICLWREYRRLNHRIRLARLRFEHLLIDDDHLDAIAADISTFGLIVRAFAQSRGRAAA